jgi:uncharacterized membrane protein YsdA (DUF1294 family)
VVGRCVCGHESIDLHRLRHGQVGGAGASLAQQWLHHKSTKQEFRAVFWATVVLNVASLVFMCSPYGQLHLGV